MNNDTPTTRSLQVVGILFLIGGIGSVVGMVFRLWSGHIYVDFGILGIPTFIGLRRLSIGWRTFGLVSIWVGLLVFPFVVVLGLVSLTQANVHVMGILLAQVPAFWLSLIGLVGFLIELWRYRVLTHPEIRALFYGPPNFHPPTAHVH